MRYYLGTHEVSWLSSTSVPLCISWHRIKNRRSVPQALAPWMLDSGGFTALSQWGQHTTSPKEYAHRVQSIQQNDPNLQYAAIQDYMCEPHLLTKTGLTIRQHQERTVQSYTTLREYAPEVHWLPVLQGWEPNDYLGHYEMYACAHSPLYRGLPVGVGSICRRQGHRAAITILEALQPLGLRLHAFGMKITGLRHASHLIASADSMAWSFDARRSLPLPGHTHKNCANCQEYALQWYEKVNGLASVNPKHVCTALYPLSMSGTTARETDSTSVLSAASHSVHG